MMKTRYIMKLVCLLVVVASCTKNNFVDSGISDGRHEGKNIIEYMEEHPYDWSLTLEMIRHAGEEMVTIFEGKDPSCKEITFFGLTNHSIRRYLLENKIKRVADLDAGWCREILLQHMVSGKMWRKDFPAGESSDSGTEGTGGITLKTLAGTQLWLYVVIREENGIIQNVAKPIYVKFIASSKPVVGIASGDIEPDNGVIHALEYNFTLGDEK